MTASTADVPLILTEAGRQLAQRARDAEAKLAAIAAACTEAEELSASTLGGIPPKVTAKHLRALLGEQPADVLLAPDEVTLARIALVHVPSYAIREDERDRVRALAERLGAIL